MTAAPPTPPQDRYHRIITDLCCAHLMCSHAIEEISQGCGACGSHLALVKFLREAIRRAEADGAPHDECNCADCAGSKCDDRR